MMTILQNPGSSKHLIPECRIHRLLTALKILTRLDLSRKQTQNHCQFQFLLVPLLFVLVKSSHEL